MIHICHIYALIWWWFYIQAVHRKLPFLTPKRSVGQRKIWAFSQWQGSGVNFVKSNVSQICLQPLSPITCYYLKEYTLISLFNCDWTFFRNAISNYGIVLRRKYDSSYEKDSKNWLIVAKTGSAYTCLPEHCKMETKQNTPQLERGKNRREEGEAVVNQVWKMAVNLMGITGAQMRYNFVFK